MTLRLTHLSRRRDILCAGQEDGWYIRFTGDQDEWDDLRSELREWGRDYARWLPLYQWDDGKKGAWWIDEGLFFDTYRDRFTNLRPTMLEAADETVQWLYKARRGWIGSHLSAYTPPPSPQPRVPAHLAREYALLEIGSEASVQEVKAAYRRLSKVYHPDTGGSHAAFIRLKSAYESVLPWTVLVEGKRVS